MVTTILLSGLVYQQSLRVLTLQDGRFVMKGPLGESSVEILPRPEPINRETGRMWLPIGGKVVTFDEQGVGFRWDGKSVHSRYASAATSDKLFSPDEIQETKDAVARGERKLEVSALSGFSTVEDKAYLLLRWDRADGTPWLEILMEIDPGATPPTARMVGRFQVFSQASGKVDNRLTYRNGKFWTTGTLEDRLCVSSIDLSSGESFVTPIGKAAGDSKFIAESGAIVAIQKTPAETLVVSFCEPDSRSIQQVAEFRGSVKGMHAPSVLEYLTNGSRLLHNLSTGALMEIEPDMGVAGSLDGVLIWSPAKAPTSASWLTPGSFRTLATWKRVQA